MRQARRKPLNLSPLLGIALFGYVLTQMVIQGVNSLILSYLNLGIRLINGFIPKDFGIVLSVTEVLF